MKETEVGGVVPAEQAEAERYRRLRPSFDRFENRHYVGLAASIALHLAILMGVKAVLIPPPLRPMVVDVELLPFEPIKASPRYRADQAKAIAGEARVREKIKTPAEEKPKTSQPDREMTMEVVRAAPASQRKRIARAPGSSPAVALPDVSAPVTKTTQSIPGPGPALDVTTYQEAGQQESLRPSVAGTGQQASARPRTEAEQGVEREKDSALISSSAGSSQTLSPEYRLGSKRKKELSSRGDTRQSLPRGVPRDASSQPDRLQASGGSATTLPAGETRSGGGVTTPAAPGMARADGAVPNEARDAERQAIAPGGESLAPEQARGAAGQNRAASASSSSSTGPFSGSPTEIRSSGGQQASAAGGSVGPAQAGAATGAAGGAALASASGSGFGKSLPGEAGGSAALQGSSGGGGALSARGGGAGGFSQGSAGAVRGVEAAPAGGGLQVASAGAGRTIGPEVQSMSAVIVPERGPAMVSRISDTATASSMQRVEAKAIAHPIEERYEAKSLKVSSPKTICELPVMLAGLDRKPLPEGLASIMGSESAMVMESAPVLLPGNVQPTYPVAALSGRHEGVVVLRAQVLTNGRVGEVFVRRSSGAAVLDQAAVNTVRGWRFAPARRNGDPVAAWVNIPIEYRNPT